MAELLLCYFDGISGVHDERGDGMTEGMEPTARNPEHIQDRPELVLHDFVGRRRPLRVTKRKPARFGFQLALYSARTADRAGGSVIGAALPQLFVDCALPDHAERRMWMHWCSKSISPHWSPSASPRTHSGHSEQNEERAPGISGKSENGLDLRPGEMSSDVCVSLGENELSHVNLRHEYPQSFAVVSIEESVLRTLRTVFLEAPTSWLIKICWFSGPI
jgi:hypothetical protein